MSDGKYRLRLSEIDAALRDEMVLSSKRRIAILREREKIERLALDAVAADATRAEIARIEDALAKEPT